MTRTSRYDFMLIGLFALILGTLLVGLIAAMVDNRIERIERGKVEARNDNLRSWIYRLSESAIEKNPNDQLALDALEKMEDEE